MMRISSMVESDPKRALRAMSAVRSAVRSVGELGRKVAANRFLT